MYVKTSKMLENTSRHHTIISSTTVIYFQGNLLIYDQKQFDACKRESFSGHD